MLCRRNPDSADCQWTPHNLW